MQRARPFAVVLLPLLAVGAAGLTGCQGRATPAAEAKSGDGDVARAKELIAQGAVLLDVRTPGEFEAGHLPGAALLPVQDLPNRIDEVERLTGGDKTKPVVVYCKSGRRAESAKRMLEKVGYQQVLNAGGYAALAGE